MIRKIGKIEEFINCRGLNREKEEPGGRQFVGMDEIGNGERSRSPFSRPEGRLD
jgi:hypothetical protein